MCEAFVIDDPLKVGFRFNPSRAGEGFRVCLISLVVMELCSLKKLTLFQHKLGKQKTFGLLQSEEYLPRINVFWTSVKDFVDT